jgi:predicted nucleic acid-binding protein
VVTVLDSSFLVAYHNNRDTHHQDAARVMEQLIAGQWGRALLLEYVFLEVVTVLMARRGTAVASSVARLLMQARELDFIPCSDLFLETVEVFVDQERSSLSFTDAAVVTLARRRPPGLIASFDRGLAAVSGVTVLPGPERSPSP